MDEELRALERSAGKGDPAAKEKLERLRARAGVVETTSDVLEAWLEVEAALEDAATAFRDDGLADYERYVEAMFAEEPGLQAVQLRGYTPGFLDGDLCEHTQSVALRAGDDGDDGDGGALAGNVITQDAAQRHTRALGAFEPVLHARHRTDWQLLLTRGADGTVKSARTRWECGY